MISDKLPLTVFAPMDRLPPGWDLVREHAVVSPVDGRIGALVCGADRTVYRLFDGELHDVPQKWAREQDPCVTMSLFDSLDEVIDKGV